MEKNTKTRKAAKKKLKVEYSNSAGDWELTYGDQSIFLRDLEDEMTTREWGGNRGIGLGNKIKCEPAIDEDDENLFTVLVDGSDFWDCWGDRKMIRLVKKYGTTASQKYRSNPLFDALMDVRF